MTTGRMHHPDPGALVGFLDSEDNVDPATREHIESCSECQSALAARRRSLNVFSSALQLADFPGRDVIMPVSQPHRSHATLWLRAAVVVLAVSLAVAVPQVRAAIATGFRAVVAQLAGGEAAEPVAEVDHAPLGSRSMSFAATDTLIVETDGRSRVTVVSGESSDVSVTAVGGGEMLAGNGVLRLGTDPGETASFEVSIPRAIRVLILRSENRDVVLNTRTLELPYEVEH